MVFTSPCCQPKSPVNDRPAASFQVRPRALRQEEDQVDLVAVIETPLVFRDVLDPIEVRLRALAVQAERGRQTQCPSERRRN